MEFLKHTLANGLEVVAECNPHAWSTAVGFFVNTGARDESDDLLGVSHFLEHMAFKGTPSQTEDDVDRRFDELGAHHNAFTSEEHTVYHAAVLPECQDRAVELLADLLQPAIRDADFTTEKHVILEEIRMYEDQPPFGADDKCRAAFFGEHPLGHKILGTHESIAALSADAMRAYHRGRYAAGNVALVAAGRVDFPALIAAARRATADWPSGAPGRTKRAAATRTEFLAIEKKSAVQQYAVGMAEGPNASDPLRYAAKLLAMVLGDDTGSRLFWELVDPGLAETVSLSHHEYEEAGIFAAYLCCDPENAEENLRRIAEVCRQVQREGIRPDELAQAKSKVGSRIVLLGERPRSRLFLVGSDWIERREYNSVQDDLRAVAAVTLDDVSRVLARFPLTRQTLVTIGPLAAVAGPCGGDPR